MHPLRLSFVSIYPKNKLALAMAELILILLGSPIGIGLIMLVWFWYEQHRPGVEVGRKRDDDDQDGGGWDDWNDIEPDLPPDAGHRITPEEVRKTSRSETLLT